MQSAANLPFRFQEVKQLAQLGLNPENFKFGNMTFESQKYICIKEGQVSILYPLLCKGGLFDIRARHKLS